MVMDVTINMGLCAYRLLPWKWEMVTECEPQRRRSLLSIACYKSEIACKTFPTSSQLHNSITLVYIPNVMAVLKITTLLKKSTFYMNQKDYKKIFTLPLLQRAHESVITHRFSSCCLFLSLCVLNSCLLLCCCKSPTHSVTTDSFPLTSHALENSMAQPNGITQ